ncbi:nuclear transport factor 2 family protein [Xanthomonas sacchari]|nr:nuclear transport factor 2 family protein [Xanthomonas sacchari]UYK65762.1 nuclear transport factor 2 family protein [Xanthomonas sacchari]
MQTNETPPNPAERDAHLVFERWHRHVVAPDLPALMALYAPDAQLESPLAYVASATRQDGRLQGRDAIAAFFAASFAQPENGLGRWYRSGRRHVSGRQLVWEYPRETPQGDQVDLVEVMDLDAAGLIACHRVYWGLERRADAASGVGQAVLSLQVVLSRGSEWLRVRRRRLDLARNAVPPQ